MRVVISQPMYFPWVGTLEQMRLADIFVFYDDVQFTRGFYNRVQIKTDKGTKWITVPLRDRHRGQKINEIKVVNSKDWRKGHIDIFRYFYRNSPFLNDALSLMNKVLLETEAELLSEVAIASMKALAEYYGLFNGKKVLCSSTLGVAGKGSQRLRDICLKLGASVYITGHGARNYLNHEMFEEAGIQVEYMNYQMLPYPQQHGDFTPFVSALDLVANCGPEGKQVICSGTIPWRRFLNESN